MAKKPKFTGDGLDFNFGANVKAKRSKGKKAKGKKGKRGKGGAYGS